VLLVALVQCASCTGQIGDRSSQIAPAPGADLPEPSPVVERRSTSGVSIPPEEEVSCPSATPQRARRISLVEYERAVTELLGAGAGLTSGFAPESSVHGFDNQSDALTVSIGNFEEFVATANVAAETVDVSQAVPCATDEAPVTCASSFIASFGSRVYGRALLASEHFDFMTLYEEGAALGGHERGIRSVIEAFLLSPYFLYRTEIGWIHHGQPARLDRNEVANTLSFALTGLRPDDELLAHAAQDADFGAPEALRAEATRLLATPAARRHLARFLRGWLGVPDVRAVNKVPEFFPQFRPAIRADLETEMTLFLDHVLDEGHGTIQALLTSPVSFTSAPMLSVIYGGDYAAPLTPPAAPPPGAFAKFEFNPKLRKGVLSVAGWLAAHSPVHRSSPVDRGLAILTRFFCQNILPPPPGAVATIPGPVGGFSTTRQKFEGHATDPVCMACHRSIDPIGFGLEMMDGMGAYRETEVGLPIDSHGELRGTDVDGPFQGPAELADRLVQSRQVRDCFVVQAFRFVEGRDEEPADACEISELQTFFAAPERSIQVLFAEMVVQPRFMQRSLKP
jgi:hypothetical protein